MHKTMQRTAGESNICLQSVRLMRDKGPKGMP